MLAVGLFVQGGRSASDVVEGGPEPQGSCPQNPQGWGYVTGRQSKDMLGSPIRGLTVRPWEPLVTHCSQGGSEQVACLHRVRKLA